MRWFILRIEMIHPYYLSEHTASSQAYRHLPLCISRGRNKEWRAKPEKPPPARAALQSRSLNAYQAADDSQPCEVGRFFLFFWALSQVPVPSKSICIVCTITD